MSADPMVQAFFEEATELIADFEAGLRCLEVTLETISQGVAVVDGDLRLAAWNRRFAEIFALPSELLRVGCPMVSKDRCLASGMDDVLRKPIRIPDLERLLLRLSVPAEPSATG